jgi:glycosyltransferase involved in cell wall biosynthesis
LRLCYIADVTSVHAQRWANYFAGKGHEVHLISRRYSEGWEGLDETIRLHSLIRLVPLPQASRTAAYISVLPWVLQVRNLVKETKADIVHADFIGVPGYLGAASGFHPLVLGAWGSDIMIVPKRNRVYRFFTKQALKRADRVICVSPALRDEMTALRVSPSKIVVIPIGVDTGKFTPRSRNEAPPDAFRPGEAPVVISTRSLKPVYDVETLIRAIPLILAEIPEAKFVIAGAGEQESQLKELARDLGVSNGTRFVGWVPRAKLPGYLSAADIYVSTSLSDGTSVSLLEAMACELSPIVTDIPANRPWIDDGENGFLFPAGDYKTLASKIIYLLNNEELRGSFGRKSREIVRKKAEQQTEMDKIDSIYAELVKGG